MLVAGDLQRLAGEAAAEVRATKAAWPLIARGLPKRPGAPALAPIGAAIATAQKLRTPALFGEVVGAALTGPGYGLASLYRGFATLAAHGWQMTGAAIAQIESGPPAAARFARTNVNLYIESIYDAHFSLAQIGKKLLAGYKKLGGEGAFGARLTQADVEALAAAYSEPAARLYPHVGVKLGS